MRVKEQETRLTLQEHDDDGDDDKFGLSVLRIRSFSLQFSDIFYVQ